MAEFSLSHPQWVWNAPLPTDPQLLYRLSVQNPEAMVSLYQKIFSRKFPGRVPTLFREDFSGAGAHASAWCTAGSERIGFAVDRDESVLKWGQKFNPFFLPVKNPGKTYYLCGEVESTETPEPVDLIGASNFGLGEFHHREVLLNYLTLTCQRLKKGGLFIADFFGGPGAWTKCRQKMRCEPSPHLSPPFTYYWEQSEFEFLKNQVFCHIHFKLKGLPIIKKAFSYHWRIWTPMELEEAFKSAGFDEFEIWTDTFFPRFGHSDSHFKRQKTIPYRFDYVALAVGFKKGN